MSVINETWLDDGNAVVLDVESDESIIAFCIYKFDESDPAKARAKLAAQAPKMARLFLEILAEAEKAEDEWDYAGIIESRVEAISSVLRDTGALP